MLVLAAFGGLLDHAEGSLIRVFPYWAGFGRLTLGGWFGLRFLRHALSLARGIYPRKGLGLQTEPLPAGAFAGHSQKDLIMSTVIKVLAIDGGGIRGIIPAIILSELQKRLNIDLFHVFDLIRSFWEWPANAPAGSGSV